MNPQYQRIREKIRELDAEIDKQEKRISTLRSERDRLKNGIEKWNLKSQEIPVSDHALVRYLERVHNIDVAALKKKLLTPSVEHAILLGAQRVRTSEYTVVIDKDKIGTVL